MKDINKKQKKTVNALVSECRASKYMSKGKLKEFESLKEYKKQRSHFTWEACDREVL